MVWSKHCYFGSLECELQYTGHRDHQGSSVEPFPGLSGVCAVIQALAPEWDTRTTSKRAALSLGTAFVLEERLWESAQSGISRTLATLICSFCSVILWNCPVKSTEFGESMGIHWKIATARLVKEKIRELIERLANGTSSLGGPYTAAKVMRVEDSKLWLRYMETKRQLTLEAQKTRFPPPNEAQTFRIGNMLRVGQDCIWRLPETNVSGLPTFHNNLTDAVLSNSHILLVNPSTFQRSFSNFLDKGSSHLVHM